mgnify:CR=1 FL=1
MANEDKKDFNAMLHDSKDMPKVQTITDQKSIEKYGGNRMYFAPPIDYDKVMKQIPYGKVITVGKSVNILLNWTGRISQSLSQPGFLYLLQHGRVTSVPKMKPRIGEP